METLFESLPVEILTEITLYLYDFDDLINIIKIIPFEGVFKDLKNLTMKFCKNLEPKLFSNVTTKELLDSVGCKIYNQKENYSQNWKLYSNIATYVRLIDNTRLLLNYVNSNTSFEYNGSSIGNISLLSNIDGSDDIYKYQLLKSFTINKAYIDISIKYDSLKKYNIEILIYDLGKRHFFEYSLSQKEYLLILFHIFNFDDNAFQGVRHYY